MINLDETLNKCYSLLDKNGFLVIALPNINSFDSKYYKEKWAALDVPRHLWHFTKKGIESLLNKKDPSTSRTFKLVSPVIASSIVCNTVLSPSKKSTPLTSSFSK